MSSYKHLKTAKEAEKAFAEYLIKKGHRVTGRNSPVDIVSNYRGKEYCFEIKSTILNARNNFFGAVTLNQLKTALFNQKYYRFVIARRINNKWSFKIYTLKQFLPFCGNGSFRIAFNIPKSQGCRIHRSKMTIPRLKKLISFHKRFKK